MTAEPRARAPADIVERLHDLRAMGVPFDGAFETLAEAAAEIERLRGERDETTAALRLLFWRELGLPEPPA